MMKARLLSILLVFLSPAFTIGQTIDTLIYRVTTLATLPQSGSEISGMVCDNEGLWMHNDSGNGPFLLRLKYDGEVSGVKRITNATNYDWEDITKDKDGNLFIGDIGNNSNTRKSLQIYKVPNPLGNENMRIEAELIEYSYPDQKLFPPEPSQAVFDAEAMIFFNDSLFVFNKNRSEPYNGFVKMYKFPAQPGVHKAILADSLYLGGDHYLNSWITGADISPDGKHLCLLSHDKIWIFTDYPNSHFFKGSFSVIKLNHFSQKEAICFNEDGVLFVADELIQGILGGRLYKIEPQE